MIGFYHINGNTQPFSTLQKCLQREGSLEVALIADLLRSACDDICALISLLFDSLFQSLTTTSRLGRYPPLKSNGVTLVLIKNSLYGATGVPTGTMYLSDACQASPKCSQLDAAAPRGLGGDGRSTCGATVAAAAGPKRGLL